MSALQALSTLYSHPYNRRHPIGALYRFSRWHVRKRGARPWTAAVWNGRRAIFWPDSVESRWLAYNHVMDWREFTFMRHFLRPGSVMFDVGANIGVYALWASAWINPSGKIVAFEPDPTNYERLRQQLSINGLHWVTPEPCAVASAEGHAMLVRGKDVENYLAIGGSPVDDSTTLTVSTTTLDAYAASHGVTHIDYLKIDVEGAELEVLKGGVGLLARGSIQVIQFEANEKLQSFGLRKIDVFDFLGTYGYHVFQYDATANNLQPANANDDFESTDHQNLFAVRDLPTVMTRLRQ